MLTIENFKRVLALVALACFFLPLCQCSAKAPAGTATNVGAKDTTKAFVPIEQVHLEEAGEIAIVALFVWPLGFLFLRKLTTKTKWKLLLNFAEVLCGLVSLTYLVLIFRIWGELRYGGVLAMLTFLV